MTSTAIPGVRGLYLVRAAELGWYVFTTLAWLVIPLLARDLGTSWYSGWFTFSGVVWLGFHVATLAAVVPFSQGRQGTPAEGTARALLVLSAMGLLFSIVQMLPEVGGPRLFAFEGKIGSALVIVNQLVWLSAEACLWLSLARSLTLPDEWSRAFWALLAVSAVLSLVNVALSHETYRRLFLGTTLGLVLRWVRFAVHLAMALLPLAALRRLMREGGVSPTVAADDSVAPPAVTPPGRDIAFGAMWLGGGLLVTLLSYSAAASGSGGGRYVVTTGAIAYGLVRLIRGFVRLGGG
jgi:hypothetical protein